MATYFPVGSTAMPSADSIIADEAHYEFRRLAFQIEDRDPGILHVHGEQVISRHRQPFDIAVKHLAAETLRRAERFAASTVKDFDFAGAFIGNEQLVLIQRQGFRFLECRFIGGGIHRRRNKPRIQPAAGQESIDAARAAVGNENTAIVIDGEPLQAGVFIFTAGAP